MFIKVFLVLVGLMLCKGNLRISVNNMTLPNKMEVEYTFKDGELVDVMCALPNKGPKCKLRMDYNFSRNYPVPDSIYNHYSQQTDANPVGFQLRMGAVNNDTHAICTCKDRQDKISKMTVNFHMKKEGDTQSHTQTPNEDEERSPMYETDNGCTMQAELKYLNGSIATPSLQLYESKNMYYIYEYKEDADFNLTCTAKCKKIRETYRKYKMHLDSVGTSEGKDSNDGMAADAKKIDKFAIDRYEVFQCNVTENGKDEPFMSRSIVFVPYIPPTTSTSTTTTTTTKTTSTPITAKTDSSTEAPNVDQEMNEHGHPPWILVATVIVAVIVIICVSAMIYKMKKRKTDQRKPQTQPTDINYQNLDSNDSPIPPFPPQWDSHYATPVDQIAEPTYSEPCIGARANTKNELYTTAIPKSRRKPANNQTSPTYEDIRTHRPTQHTLDDPNYAEIVPQNAAFKNELNLMYAKVLPKSQRNKNDYGNEDNSPYAEVVPKSMRKEGGREGGGKYENVHTGRYVNVKSDGEYAEPAYCEPTYLNKK